MAHDEQYKPSPEEDSTESIDTAPSPAISRPSGPEWNYIQKIYHRSNHPDWKNWDQKTRGNKALKFWEDLKQDALWKETFVEFQDEHAVFLDDMDFWKKDIRRATLQRQKRAFERDDVDQENERPKQRRVPPKKKRKVVKRVKAPMKPKESDFGQLTVGGTITLKGDGYEVGDFGLLLTEALSTEMKIDCKLNVLTISWETWDSLPGGGSKKILRILMDIDHVHSLHLGAYQKWAHSKQESVYLDIKMKRGKPPRFLQKVHMRGKTETEIKFEDTKDFTRGSALRTSKHRFKVRCAANKSKMHNLYQNLLACDKFERVALDNRFH